MLTYCNPLPLPDLPRGKDEWYPFEHDMFSHENKPASVTTPDYRSVSDPTVFYHDGRWYLYPSYGMAWVSEDFVHWTHVRTEPYCPKYSPCITKWGDKFLFTSWNSPLYECDCPTGPFRKLGDFLYRDGSPFVPCDPCIFTDDDGRLYLYAFEMTPEPSTRIIGYELDRENPRQVIDGPRVILTMNPRENPWERQGKYGQNKNFGWVEGPHLLKHNGRYYMIYAAPDTCHPNYCMAVYYSDEGPLTGFFCQKKNPLTLHMAGIVSGTGHGCVEHGPNGSLWAFYTVATPYLQMYERRIGMDPVAVDENGELYCPLGITDTPQYAPGTPLAGAESPGYVNLTAALRPVVVSSALPGRDGLYATDESSLTFWQPEDNDPAPTLIFDLLGSFRIAGLRLFFRDVGLDYAAGRIPTPVHYTVDGLINGNWQRLAERTDDIERNIDYFPIDAENCKEIRLKLVPRKNIGTGVIDFAVFGKME